MSLHVAYGNFDRTYPFELGWRGWIAVPLLAGRAWRPPQGAHGQCACRGFAHFRFSISGVLGVGVGGRGVGGGVI